MPFLGSCAYRYASVDRESTPRFLSVLLSENEQYQ
jgi:hypothetical protein